MSSFRKGIINLLERCHLVGPIKKIKHRLLNLLPKTIGIKRYARMQLRRYKNYTQNYDNSKVLCVGNFDDHEQYPYEEYLLEKYVGSKVLALDFGCGMGRMIKRMLAIFDQVDGADLMQSNLDYAKIYLTEENGIDKSKYNLFKTDGMGCKISVPYKYDFIFSTICLQHIAVHQTRFKIFQDLCDLLSDQGQACLQMGFGWDNGCHWFDNEYGADQTNSGLDVSIPDKSYLPAIADDFKRVGFSKVEFTFKQSPHGASTNYHPEWIFIHLWR